MKTIKVVILLIFIFTACNSEPVPVKIGEEECEYCKMVISDPKFVGELITSKGKIFKFDSIECLAAFYSIENKKNIKSVWAANYYDEKKFLNAANCSFLVSSVNSPMGLNLIAFKDKNDLSIIGDEKLKELKWKDVVAYVQKQWN